MGTGAFDAFDFGTLNLPHTYARLRERRINEPGATWL
jgi:hypothetical protein